MIDTLTLRAATVADAGAIAAVCTRAARLAYATLVSEDYLDRAIAHFHGVERIRREVAADKGWFGFTVVTHASQVVGVAGTGTNSQQPGVCELFTLYVDPPWQRQGVGRALVTHAIAEAVTFGARRLDVAVMPGNLPAVRFYQSCGFTAAGERPIYAPHGEHGGPPVALVFSRTIATANPRSAGAMVSF
jgi:ribosomal protein S18 acetylase RimI-like enzyme